MRRKSLDKIKWHMRKACLGKTDRARTGSRSLQNVLGEVFNSNREAFGVKVNMVGGDLDSARGTLRPRLVQSGNQHEADTKGVQVFLGGRTG